MSAIFHESGFPSFLAPVPRFSFFEQAVIEIPAPQKYAWAQEERRWILRNQGPEWYLSNELWAHKFYMMKRPWWMGMV